MQLTLYTDYALRIMLHVGAQDDGHLVSVAQIADVYSISRNHLMKVVQHLGQGGFLKTLRGRNGGLKLGRPASEITIGQLVRHTEQGFELVDCSTCLIASACTLPRVLGEATRAFLAVLDQYTLDAVLDRKLDLRRLFGGASTLDNFLPDL